MLTAEQRALRHTGIGASEIGTVVGADGAWETPLALWAKKTGLVEESDDTEVPEYIELGNLLEPVVASLYMRRTGLELYEPGTLRHLTDPLRVATPDRLVVDRPLGVQIKKARTRAQWGQEGTDDVPQNIVAQVQWEMSVADLESEDVAVLFWGSHLAIYTVKRDDGLIEGLAELAHKWWRDHVVANVPPTPDGSERAKEALAKIYPANRGNLVKLGMPELGSAVATVFAYAQDYVTAREEARSADERKELAGNMLRSFIQNNDGFEAPWGKITWLRGSGGRTSWREVAEELRAPKELIEKHTKPPERRLTVHLKGEK